MSFGTTPVSTTALGTNQFPVSTVYVPNTTGSNLTALQGGPSATDSNGQSYAPAMMYLADGNNVTQGTQADGAWSLSGNATEIAILKKVALLLNGTLAVSGTVSAAQSGTWNINTVSGTVSLPTGAATSAKQPAPGTAGSASTDVISVQGITSMTPLKVDGSGVTQPVSGTVTVQQTTATNLKVDLSGTSANTTAIKVDGSAVTQPVSGTFWQATQPVSGTITANAGTNLNTSALALDTSVNGILLAQASTTSGQKGVLIQGAVTTSLPTYTTAQTSPISLTTAGAIRVDASATTQPVSGTVTANAGTGTFAVAGTVTANQGGTNWSTNVAQFGGSNIVTGTGASGSGIPRVTVSNDSNMLATQSGTWTVQPGNTANTTAWLVQSVTGTTGGSTPSHTMSAASTNATSLKASAGMVYGLSISNANASARYFKLYDKSSSPTIGTDTPKMTVQVPGNGTVIRAFPVGLVFSNGIAWGCTGGIADSDTTAIGANDCSIDIDYR